MYKSKFNNVLFGTTIGIIVPIIIFIIIYFVRFGHLELGTTIKFMVNKKIFTPLLSLCVIPNLLLFFVFMWTNKLLSGRGMILATLIFTLSVVVLKIIF